MTTRTYARPGEIFFPNPLTAGRRGYGDDGDSAGCAEDPEEIIRVSQQDGGQHQHH